MRKRWIVIGGVLVALLGISVASVAIHREFLQGRWDASNAATDLEEQLTALSGVESATVEYQPFALPDAATKVSVTLAPDASPEDWGAAHSLVRDAASSPALRGTITAADFRETGARTATTVDSLLLTSDTVTSEIAAWRALREVVGDRVSLHLGKSTSAQGQLWREYSVSDAQDMREIAKLWTPDLGSSQSSLKTHWIAPGMELYRMPSTAEMTALEAVADVVPLANLFDPDQAGTVAAIILDFRGINVQLISVGEGGGEGNLANDPPDDLVAAAAQAAFVAGAATVYWSSASHGNTLIAGECATYKLEDGTELATELVTGDDDEWFAAQLAELGFVIPSNVHPGSCQPLDW